MKITFLIHNVYGIGGTIRTTLNLAAALSDDHEVEIASMLRHREHPRFTIDPRVTVVPLVDTREDSDDAANPLLHEPAKVFPAAEKRHRTLDAVITTTEADAAVYRAKMRLPGVRVLAVPNSVPEPDVEPSDGTAKVIAAAGRLVRSKRFDLLIEAFTDIAVKHPDWYLRIYGAGADKPRLQQLIDSLGLHQQAALMGARSPIEAEFSKASIVAVASDAESFGMTIVEAMLPQPPAGGTPSGVPVVSTDCPLGPAEIIHDGVDGRLVPVGDREAMATALLDLIADESARRTMGQAARTAARRFDPAPIAHAYNTLFTDLRASRGSRAWQRWQAALRARLRRAMRRLRR